MAGARRWFGRTAGRVVLAYAVMAAVLVGSCIWAFTAGGEESPPEAIGGIYPVEAAGCLGAPGDTFALAQSGTFLTISGAGSVGGKLRLDDTKLTGSITCADGSKGELDATATVENPDAEEPSVHVAGTAAGTQFASTQELTTAETAAAPVKRKGEETFGRLMLAIAVVLLVARAVGAVFRRIGQPQVMGEVLAGILLGPTLLGAIAPEVKDYLFPSDIIPLITAGADIGLAFYMFLVGLELDTRILKGRIGQAAVVSNASVALPMALGLIVAVPLYPILAPNVDYVAFALFTGVAMSITAFPVLARILVERRMLKRPTGAMALAAAAVDDVTAWGLLALAAAVARGTGAGKVGEVIGYAILFCAAMGLIVRRFVGRMATARDEAGRVPAGWIVAVFVGVLLSAYLTTLIGIAAIFGAFVMGLIMPKRADLTADVAGRVEPFVVMVLLPLFFVVTGLKTEFGLLDRPELWLIALLLLAVAITGKWLGAMLAARVVGVGWRESAALGALMNTRGLTELIVLNLGLELGVISPALFTMLVIMAIVTTAMAGPALRLIDPKRLFSAPVEEELQEVAPVAAAPERAIVVSPQNPENAARLLALAEPLARSAPPRELILVGLVPPMRTATGIAGDERDLRAVHGELDRTRELLHLKGIAARTVAFTSVDPGSDLVRLATEQEVDVLLLDGRRPLLGGGVPRGAVGTALATAPSDVAVLVEHQGAAPDLGPGNPVVVPFGGAEHDWAALELGAWIAAATDAPLRLLGASADAAGDGRDASRLLGSASLVVQQLTGIAAEPVLVEPGRAGIVRAASGASLLVVGLSPRWREEGLGPVRTEIARSAAAPILFVRRGLRPSALAPSQSMTRFTWSVGTMRPPEPEPEPVA